MKIKNLLLSIVITLAFSACDSVTAVDIKTDTEKTETDYTTPDTTDSGFDDADNANTDGTDLSTTNTSTDTYTVTPSPNAPTIVLSATNVTKEDEMAVFINANQSSDNNTSMSNLDWQWKEGTTVLSTGSSLNHIFPLGLHTVVFRLQDTDGLSSYANITITIININSKQITWKFKMSETINF